MAVLEVLKYPDPRLRHKAKPVGVVSVEHRRLAEDMLETMYSFKGIGLAAIQVASQVRVLVTDTRPRENGRYKPEEMTDLERAVDQPLVLFDPVVTRKEGKTTYEEGCLSLPTYYDIVERSAYIEVTALDRDGAPISLKCDGLLAICIQHEIDHLDGKLFIDRLSPLKSARIKNKIKKFGYPDPNKADNENDEEPDAKRTATSASSSSDDDDDHRL